MSIHNRITRHESEREGGCPYMKSLGCGHTQGVNKGKGNVHTRVKCPYKEESVFTKVCVHTR